MSELTLLLKTDLEHLSAEARAALPAALSAFLDAAATAAGRASFYNTADEQAAAIERAHAGLQTVDRGLYAIGLLLPGASDHTRRVGLRRLLATRAEGPSLLTAEQEGRALTALVDGLPPARRLKALLALVEARLNSARVRKLILRTVLGSRKLERWAVSYRRKLARLLRHAWGQRRASIVAAVLAKPESARDARERALVRRELTRYAVAGGGRSAARVAECVRFVLGDEDGLTLPALVAYAAAKLDLERGRRLPYETLEGIRSRFHREATSARVLELTKAQLTAGQRIAMQRKADEAGVEVTFDPTRHDAVRLYRYALEMGMDETLRSALRDKARAAAAGLPLRLGRIAIVVDASASMAGDATRRHHPIAVALAVRDALAAAAEAAVVLTSDGRPAPAYEPLTPQGDSSLGAALVAALRARVAGTAPQAVFVLSDGYENAPAGRFADVLRAARALGCETPVTQLSPVLAAEAGGVRTLAEGNALALPVGRPTGLGLALLKAMVRIDAAQAVTALLTMVGPQRLLPGPTDETRLQTEPEEVTA